LPLKLLIADRVGAVASSEVRNLHLFAVSLGTKAGLGAQTTSERTSAIAPTRSRALVNQARTEA
jgi:hypothetical protein